MRRPYYTMGVMRGELPGGWPLCTKFKSDATLVLCHIIVFV